MAIFPNKLLVDPHAKDLVGQLRRGDALYGRSLVLLSRTMVSP